MTEEPTDKPSKSARKRRLHELQQISSALLQFSDSQLKKLPLTEPLQEAVREGKRLKAPAALQRHYQFLGRLLDEADSDELLAAIGTLGSGKRQVDRWHHQAEKLRDALIAGESALWQPWLESLDSVAQVQVKKQAERACQALQRGQDAARESRQLYRLLHALLEAAEPASS